MEKEAAPELNRVASACVRAGGGVEALLLLVLLLLVAPPRECCVAREAFCGVCAIVEAMLACVTIPGGGGLLTYLGMAGTRVRVGCSRLLPLCSGHGEGLGPPPPMLLLLPDMGDKCAIASASCLGVRGLPPPCSREAAAVPVPACLPSAALTSLMSLTRAASSVNIITPHPISSSPASTSSATFSANWREV